MGDLPNQLLDLGAGRLRVDPGEAGLIERALQGFQVDHGASSVAFGKWLGHCNRLAGITTNSAAPANVLEDVARPDSTGLTLLHDAADAMRLSARGYHRVLRVARTLADLDGADKVGRVHLAEALSYRALTDEMRRAA